MDSLKDSLRLVPHDEVALVEWDMPGEKVNKLSSAMMMRFKELLEELDRSSYEAVVFYFQKKKYFYCGGRYWGN